MSQGAMLDPWNFDRIGGQLRIATESGWSIRKTQPNMNLTSNARWSESFLQNRTRDDYNRDSARLTAESQQRIIAVYE